MKQFKVSQLCTMYALLFFVGIFSFANDALAQSAIIIPSNWKKTERRVYECKGEIKCEDIKKHKTEGKFKESLTFAVFNAMMGPLSPDSVQEMRLKTETAYQPWYTERYGISKCESDHVYKNFIGLSQIIFHPSKIGKEELTITSRCTGEKGADHGTKDADTMPDIDPRKKVGSFAISVPSERETVKFSVKEDMRSILIFLPPIKDRNMIGKFLEDMVKSQIESVPIIGGVIENQLLEKKYEVTLTATVTELVPKPLPETGTYFLEEKPIPCKDVKIGGKTLDSNCQVTFKMSKKRMTKDVTPIAKAAYYEYNLAFAAGPIKPAQLPKHPFFAFTSELLSIKNAYAAEYEEGNVRLDQDGFLILEGWDSEDFKMSERESETPQTIATESIKPDINVLRKTVMDLQARIQALRDKIDAVKCSRGLAPCKNKTLIPSKPLLPLLPMENKKQQLGDILETLKGLVQIIENGIR